MRKENYILAIARIAMGWIFLWTFLDKNFGLGLSTLREKSWLAGNSPTSGFLTSIKGPFAFFYNNLAGNIFVDWLFMIGLLLIGISLILGVFNKLATYSGSLLMLLMYAAVIPIKNNPLIDEHVIYLLILLLLNFFRAGDYFGLRKKWAKTSFVKRFKFFE